MNEDRTSGTVHSIGGKTEDTVGSASGDARMQAQGKGDQIAAKAQEAFGGAKDAIASAATRAGAQASEMGGQVYDKGTQAAEYVGGQIREQPVIAMFAAMGIGVLIGYLIGRSPSEHAVQLGRFRASYRDR